MTTLRFACGSAMAVAAAMSLSTPASAQTPPPDTYINIGTYALAIPVGDTRRFIAPVGIFGMGWDGQWLLHSHFSKGISFALNDFSDTRKGTTEFPSGAVTGHQASELLVMSLMGTARWYPGNNWGRGLYLGMGLGGEFDQQYY